MKITTKTTKEQLKQFLGANAPTVQQEDKALYEQLVYADKMMDSNSNKVTRQDLVDLAKSVMKSLGDKCVDPISHEPLAENSVKKLKSSNKKEETKKEETVQTEEKVSSEGKKTEGKEANKKSANKSLGKKKDQPTNGNSVLKSKKAVELADTFPQTITQDGDTFELAEDIKSMEDLYKAYENDETIVFAFYWTARHLKQFSYYNNQLACPNSFPLDLDLCTALHVSEDFRVTYALSMYTEANYAIFPQDFEVDESNGVRYCGGIEFQIYRLV